MHPLTEQVFAENIPCAGHADRHRWGSGWQGFAFSVHVWGGGETGDVEVSKSIVRAPQIIVSAMEKES